MKRSRASYSPIRYNYFEERTLIEDLLALPEIPGGLREQNIQTVAKDLAEKLPTHQYGIQQVIVDIILEHPTKHCAVAYLVALLRVKGEEGESLTKAIVSALAEKISAALKDGHPIHAKLGLRFLLCCSTTKVLSPSAVAALVKAFLEQASLAAASGQQQTNIEEHGSKSSSHYYYYADFLAYCVLSSLPWAMCKLHKDNKDAAAAILKTLEDYMQTRKSQRSANSSLGLYKNGYPELKITTACSTSGSVGHVNWVWSLYTKNQQASIGDFDWTKLATESVLCFGEGEEAEAALNGIQSIEEDGVVIQYPDLATASRMERFQSAIVSHCSFLPEQHTKLGESVLNQFVIEEYVVDLMTLLNRSQPKLLSTLLALPVKFQYQSVLAESIFAHMFQLPKQQFAPMFYSGVISDLCLKMESFPKFMSACVRYAVEKIDQMDLEACQRLARWQAYHLSAFQYQWPWERWGWTEFPQREESDRRRLYIEDVFAFLQRLSYHEHILKKVPEQLHPLVSTAGAVPNKQGKAGGDNDDDENEKNIDLMSQLMFKKKSAEDILAYLEGLGGASAKHVILAVLCIGGKSFTHMRTLLKRYRKVIDHFVQENQNSSAEAKILDLLFQVWSSAPDKFMMGFTCILEAGIVNDVDALKWAVSDTQGLVASRSRIKWSVVDSSLTACVSMCTSKTNAEDTREYFLAGIKEAWQKMAEGFGGDSGGGKEENPWFTYSLQHCHVLLRKHSEVLRPILSSLIAEKCANDLAKETLLAGLQCFEVAVVV
jgi:hypothetical protein